MTAVFKYYHQLDYYSLNNPEIIFSSDMRRKTSEKGIILDTIKL